MFRVTVAPKRRATSSRSGFESIAMMIDAPLSFAPSVAHSPIGPCANTATLSPTRIPPLSAPERPVEKMSGHNTTSSSVRPDGMGARLAFASGTSRYSAQAPLMVLPNFQPPNAPPHCEDDPFRQ
jgi:hypothetical protein